MTWRSVTLAVWAALALGLLVGQRAAVLGKWRLPTASAVVRRVTSDPLGRTVLLVFWMWLGWHTFAR